MAIRESRARYSSATGLSTFERIAQRFQAPASPHTSYSLKRIMELEDLILKLSERHPGIFDYSPQEQLQFAERYLIAKEREKQKEEESKLRQFSFAERIKPVQIISSSKFSINKINKLKTRFMAAPYHEVFTHKKFFDWFSQIVNSFKNSPDNLKITYGVEKNKFRITIQQWLKWLFSDKSLNQSNKQKLEILGNHKLSERLSIGSFNELRVGLALHSLKAAGVIKDFILAKKDGNDDQLGIDALVIIHEYKIGEDKTGDTLSVPIQVKSREGDPVYDFDTEASYPLSKSESEYMMGTKNLPNTYKIGSELNVERAIPMIKASGQSITKLKEQIVKLIQESFKRNRFLEFFGKYENKSFVHKLKLLLEQDFMKIKPQSA